MSQSSQIMVDLDTVGGIVARAETDLAAGVVLDFAPLESRIEELCARIAGLPPGEGRAVQSKLLTLVGSFDRLVQSIETAMSQLKIEMGGVSGRRRAASAYAKSSEPNK